MNNLIYLQCKKCNERFIPSIRTQVYCNNVCKRKARDRRRYIIKRDIHRKMFLSDIECKRCDTVFTQQNRRQVYCSKKCSITDERLKAKLKRNKKLVTNCIGCGKIFIPQHGNQHYCNYQCRSSFYNSSRLNDLPKRPCKSCGKLFVPFSKKQVYCDFEKTNDGRSMCSKRSQHRKRNIEKIVAIDMIKQCGLESEFLLRVKALTEANEPKEQTGESQ